MTESHVRKSTGILELIEKHFDQAGNMKWT